MASFCKDVRISAHFKTVEPLYKRLVFRMQCCENTFSNVQCLLRSSFFQFFVNFILLFRKFHKWKNKNHKLHVRVQTTKIIQEYQFLVFNKRIVFLKTYCDLFFLQFQLLSTRKSSKTDYSFYQKFTFPQFFFAQHLC